MNVLFTLKLIRRLRSFYATSLLCLVLFADTSVRAQNILDPKTQRQFINALPVPAIIDARCGGSFTLSVSQFQQDLGLVDPVTGRPMPTKVWGYNGSYPGPTILARKNFPVDILWGNKH